MTDKEILEYSKQLIDAKKEIENSEVAAPDFEEQVRTKFSEDSVNRSKFIDSTVVIGGATKEFRNIFGIDAPHYELNNDCYFAIDKNIQPSKEDVLDLLRLNEFFLKKNFFEAHRLQFPNSRANLLEKLKE